MHQSYMCFLWHNWRKSTFYPVTAPNDSKCWPIVTSSIQEPVASNCDVTMTNCYRVVAMVAFAAQFVTPVFQHGASKNIRYLLWNRGVWRFFHDTYLTIEVQGIRCTNHLHDSCPLTDVNPYFTAPGCRYYFKINRWWPIVIHTWASL